MNANSIAQFDGATGAYLGILASGSPIVSPSDLLALPDGSLLATMSGGQNSIEKFNPQNGSYAGNFAPSGSGGLDVPASSLISPDGYVYVASFSSNSVIRYDAGSGSSLGAFVDAADGVSGPLGIALDTSGNLYVANWGNSKILVISGRSGTLFGVSVTANVMATLSSSGLLNHPYGLVFDLQDNLYIANEYANNILVLPNSSGTLFGVSVTVNTMAVLSSSSLLSSPRDLAFDAKNNLHITSGNKILVLPSSSGTLFGVPVTVNTMVVLSSSSLLNGPVGLIFDLEDNLFIANQGNNNILVFPATSGVFFDVPVTANTMTILSQSSLISQPICLAFDSGGNLYIINYADNNILVLPI